MDKRVALNNLKSEYLGCQKCAFGNKIVFGEGVPNSIIFVVGEAPGAEEEEEGRPFVGKAGKSLRKMMEDVGISIPDVYISNACIHRPPDNRKPTSLEIDNCRDRLRKEIQIVSPKIIVLVGTTPLEAVTGKKAIGKNRGIQRELPKKSPMLVYATYHPSCTNYGSLEQRAERHNAMLSDWREIAKLYKGWIGC